MEGVFVFTGQEQARGIYLTNIYKYATFISDENSFHFFSVCARNDNQRQYSHSKTEPP